MTIIERTGTVSSLSTIVDVLTCTLLHKQVTMTFNLSSIKSIKVIFRFDQTMIILTIVSRRRHLRTLPIVHIEHLVVHIRGTGFLTRDDIGSIAVAYTAASEIPLVREVVDALECVLAVDHHQSFTCWGKKRVQ